MKGQITYCSQVTTKTLMIEDHIFHSHCFHFHTLHEAMFDLLKHTHKQTNSVALSPRANYTD
jgi:hypothetical protein